MADGTSRREFVQKGLAATGAAVLGARPAEAGVQGVGGKRPNLIFIYNEGQRADALSMAGHPILKTPNQDRIGREGLYFNNAFCTNALCAPARAAAMTGMWSRSTGALDNQLLNTPLPKDIPVFTDQLREVGYKTAILGKVHTRNALKERYWDYYFGFNAPNTNFYNPRYAEGRDGKIGPEKVYKNQYADDLLTDKALGWLEQEKDSDKPFCLMLWFQTPHAPYFRARRHLDLYNGLAIPKPETFDDDLKGYPGKPTPFVDADNKIGTTATGDAVRSLEELCKDYYAGSVAIDENIGRVMAFLERTGKMDDTAIVVTSDHGYFLGEWRLFDKRLMHEPSIRVPMMIRYPKRIKAGTVKDEMVLDVDIAPTLLDLAGLPAAKTMQGRSMLEIGSKDAAPWRREWLYDYYEYPGNENVMPHRGVRTQTHKLIEWYTTEKREWEMYDLVKDPKEIHNLYGRPEHAALEADLKTRLERLLKATPVRA
jgi:arylsulfatase A-like enzyme